MLLFCLQDAVLGGLVISWEAQHETLGGPLLTACGCLGALWCIFFLQKGHILKRGYRQD